jgi:hypothetical protein
MGMCRSGASPERFRRDFFQTFNAPGAEQQFGAFRAEGPCRCRAKATRCSGNQDPFIFQWCFHGEKNLFGQIMFFHHLGAKGWGCGASEDGQKWRLANAWPEPLLR